MQIAQLCGLPIKRDGDRCKSPLRPEATNPTSFVVFNDFWYDHGSLKGGDCIDLYAELACKTDRGTAIRTLANHVGMSCDMPDGWHAYTQNLGNGIVRWHNQLMDPDFPNAPAALDYLHSRRISDETIIALKIGFNSSRIVIPYWRNEYAYNWIGRAFAVSPAKPPEPRYYKLKSDQFSDQMPFGMDTITRCVPSESTLYIAEGAFDALSIYQANLPVLATMGGQFPRTVLQSVVSICKRFKRVVLTFDSDDAGQSFARAFGSVLFDGRVGFDVVRFPDGFKDVSEWHALGNQITDLKTVNGLDFMAQATDSIDALTRLASRAARLYTPTDAVRMLEPALHPQYTAKQLTAAEKTAVSAPSESVILHELVQNHPHLRHVDNVGFYEYTHGVWRKLSDDTVKGYVHPLYGVFKTNQRVSAVTNLARSDPRVAAQMEFDRKPLWCFTNGTLELDTGVFRDSSPDDYCSIQMHYPYDPTARSDEWVKFIETVAHEDEYRMEALQQIAGYVLFNDCRMHKIIMFTGNGRNGKSVYLDVLKTVYGPENCSVFAPEDLTQDFQRIQCKDAVLNIGPDIKPSIIGSESTLKSIAAGDTQKACYKGKDYVTFNPRVKLIFSYNGDMKSSDGSDGLAERLLIVNFPCKFVDNPDKNNPYEIQKDIEITRKLTAQANLPGVFNWCYEGYKSLQMYKEFIEPYEQAEFVKGFVQSADDVQAFYDDTSYSGKVVRDDIYVDFHRWCLRVGILRPITRDEFWKRFKRIVADRVIKTGNTRPKGTAMQYGKYVELSEDSRERMVDDDDD